MGVGTSLEGEATERHAVRSSELAWIALLPCALVTACAIAFLAPPLGRAFLGPGSETLWPSEAIYVFGQPEPVKHARYLIAMLGPVLLAGALLAGARWEWRLPRAVAAGLVTASQALTLAFLTLALLAQYDLVFGSQAEQWRPFSVAAIAIAVVLPPLLVRAMRDERVRARAAAWAIDTRARRIAAVAIAAGYAAAWLLSAVDSDGSIAFAQTANLIPWGMDDPFAVLDGRTPLVDFYAMYAQLWPFPLALAMEAFGTTIAVYTLLLAAAGVATLLAVYAVLRRVTGSSLAALALYLPIVAAGFMLVVETTIAPLSNVKIFSMWPLRFGGPYVIAWLTIRHVDGAAPRRAWPIFLLAGLVAIDNLEFGVAALAAVVVALACAQRPTSRREGMQQLGEAALGLLAAVLIVVALTLARTDQLPRVELLLEFPHIFGVLGLAAQPMPTIGIHLVLYATFIAALATAIVRALRGARQRTLTAMLAWSGVFGLLASSYYIGRSDEFKLASLFSPWSLALALLVVVVLRGLAARGWRRPRAVELAVLGAFALTVAFLPQVPTPWAELSRIDRTSQIELWKLPRETRFVAERTRPGESVAILIPMGHRIAYDLGLDNVAPYSFMEAMATRRQLQTLIEAMRDEGARKLFLLTEAIPAPEQFLAKLSDEGFVLRSEAPGIAAWEDAVAPGRPR